MGGRPGLGGFSCHAAHEAILMNEIPDDPKLVVDRLGHTLDDFLERETGLEPVFGSYCS